MAVSTNPALVEMPIHTHESYNDDTSHSSFPGGSSFSSSCIERPLIPEHKVQSAAFTTQPISDSLMSAPLPTGSPNAIEGRTARGGHAGYDTSKLFFRLVYTGHSNIYTDAWAGMDHTMSDNHDGVESSKHRQSHHAEQPSELRGFHELQITFRHRATPIRFPSQPLHGRLVTLSQGPYLIRVMALRHSDSHPSILITVHTMRVNRHRSVTSNLPGLALRSLLSRISLS